MHRTLRQLDILSYSGPEDLVAVYSTEFLIDGDEKVLRRIEHRHDDSGYADSRVEPGGHHGTDFLKFHESLQRIDLRGDGHIYLVRSYKRVHGHEP